MQNLNERGAAYIPIAEVRGITPHSDKTERLLERAKENPQTDAKRWKCSIVTTNTNARSVKPNQIATTTKRKPLSFTFQKQQASLSPIMALKD